MRYGDVAKIGPVLHRTDSEKGSFKTSGQVKWANRMHERKDHTLGVSDSGDNLTLVDCPRTPYDSA